MRNLLIITAVLFLSQNAFAGFFELGLSASYKEVGFDDDNFSKSNSTTGSFAYYFAEMSAFELSFTQGTQIESFVSSGSTPSKLEKDFTLMGADFVFTFAGRKAFFQPFVKIGFAKIDKITYFTPAAGTKSKINEVHDEVPSVGLGFKIKLTKTFSLKLGLDAWSADKTTGFDEIHKWDKSARVGISWFL